MPTEGTLYPSSSIPIPDYCRRRFGFDHMVLAIRSGSAAWGRARGALRPGTAALQRAAQPVGALAPPAAALQRARARPPLHPARLLGHRPRLRLALLVAPPSPAPHWVRSPHSPHSTSHPNPSIRSSSSHLIHIVPDLQVFILLLASASYPYVEV